MDSLSGTASTDPAAYYVWEVPGKPVTVHLSYTAIDHILQGAGSGPQRLLGRGREVGGLLLGTLESGATTTVRVEDAVAVPTEYAFGPFYAFSERDTEFFGETLREWQPSADRPIRAVGFYRTQPRDELVLNQHDLSLFRDYFSDPSHVALLIKPRLVRSSVAGIFFQELGQFWPGPSYLEFPIRARKRAARAPVLGPAPTDAAGDVPVPAFPSRPRPPLWASWWVQVPILACLLAVDGLLGFVSARQVRPPPPPAAAAPRDPFALSLMVVEYSDNLSLTWDRNAVAIRQAERAVLTINDGGNSQTLEVEPGALRNPGFGVTYHRLTGQVRFRLEVFLKNRRSVSETWEMGESVAAKAAR